MKTEPLRKTIVALAIIISFVSCQKNIPSPVSNATPTSFSQIFDQFWNGMNTNYVYWDIDSTDWDAVHAKYKPLFARLNLQDNNDIKKSVGYFREMTAGLVDGHYEIGFLPKAIVDSFVFPVRDRKLQSPDFHSSFLYLSIDSCYFDRGFATGSYVTQANEQITATCATIQGKVLYFSCSGFSLQEAFGSNGNNGVKNVLQSFFNQLQNLPQGIKALMIDVRNNRGGNLADLGFLLGHIINKPLQFGFAHSKGGNGRLDFTPWVAATASPQPGGAAFSLPTIVLADHYSVSTAEAVTMAIKAMPNSSFVGETTWGATGPITDNVVYNDGQFGVPGFLSVYTSSVAFKYIDGKSYEDKGFPPDIAVPFNLTSLFSGDDPVLDKAISLIR